MKLNKNSKLKSAHTQKGLNQVTEVKGGVVTPKDKNAETKPPF